jgi:Ca-activated chloride channel family protein
LDQAELRRAYQAIAELEPDIYETISFRPRQSLHWLPVAVALVLYSLYHSFGTWRTWRALRRAGTRHAS